MGRRFVYCLLIGSLLSFAYCTSSKKIQEPIQYMPITYDKHVKPLIIAKCAPCHLHDGNEVSYDDYESAKENITEIIRRIKKNPGEHGFMPEKAAKLSDSLIHVFEQWKTDSLLQK